MARKKQSHIRNWGKYNKALINRGSLTIWFDEESIAKWHDTQRTNKRGRPCVYADIAIRCALSIRYLFKQSLRATKGFVMSLIQLLKLPIKAPDYSTLSRRQADLELPEFPRKKEPVHLVIDSTGFKIFGEGEWKVKQHGKEKRRTWRKLHIAVDESTHEVMMAVITNDKVSDCHVLPELLSLRRDLDITQVTGDGAYDTRGCYKATMKAGAKPCFPPRKGAARHKPTNKGVILRNQAIKYQKSGNLKKWKIQNNYHKRSLVETAMFRMKKIFGGSVASRLMKNQKVEMTLRCHMLNKITSLGMPDSIMM